MRPPLLNNPMQQFPNPPQQFPDRSLEAYAYWRSLQDQKKFEEKSDPLVSPLVDRFTRAEREAARLRQDLSVRQLTNDQIKARLLKLVVQDEQRVWWMVNYKSGRWLRHNGTRFIRAEPPRHRAPAVSPSPRFDAAEETHWGRRIAWFVVFLILLGVVVAIASS